MNKNIFSDYVKAISEANFADEESDEYVVVSVCPSEKVASMIDVWTELNQNKFPLSRLADLISVELADFAKSRLKHASCIKETANEYQSVDPKSALGILEKDGYYRMVPKNPFFNK